MAVRPHPGWQAPGRRIVVRPRHAVNRLRAAANGADLATLRGVGAASGLAELRPLRVAIVPRRAEAIDGHMMAFEAVPEAADERPD
jgi:hypothetical protein